MNYESMTDRELDALVAEKVMGWKQFDGVWCKGGIVEATEGGWNPTEDIERAFEVVEAMREWGFDMSLTATNYRIDSAYRAIFAKKGEVVHSGIGPAPRAIVIAALRALDE